MEKSKTISTENCHFYSREISLYIHGNVYVMLILLLTVKCKHFWRRSIMRKQPVKNCQKLGQVTSFRELVCAICVNNFLLARETLGTLCYL